VGTKMKRRPETMATTLRPGETANRRRRAYKRACGVRRTGAQLRRPTFIQTTHTPIAATAATGRKKKWRDNRRRRRRLQMCTYIILKSSRSSSSQTLDLNCCVCCSLDFFSFFSVPDATVWNDSRKPRHKLYIM